MKKAAFLDRDGVLNASVVVGGIPFPPRTPNEVVVLEGVEKAIRMLKLNDFVPVVVSNQPDVARGKTSISEVEAINKRIRAETSIEYFYICAHDDADGCDCRKPNPGLILNAAKDLDLDLSSSFMIGDRWRDVAAGVKAGLRCFFIDYSYSERAPEQPFTRVSSLLEATYLVIGENN